jgi:hypothetical protein
MPQRVQLRVSGLAADQWRSDLLQELNDSGLAKSVVVTKDQPSQQTDSRPVIDPTIVAAMITGGSAVVVSLISVLVGILQSKTQPAQAPPAQIEVKVTFHGTANSQSREWSEGGLKEREVDEVLDSVGPLTEIEVGSSKETLE